MKKDTKIKVFLLNLDGNPIKGIENSIKNFNRKEIKCTIVQIIKQRELNGIQSIMGIDNIGVPDNKNKEEVLTSLFDQEETLEFGKVIFFDTDSENPLFDISRLIDLISEEGDSFAIGYIPPFTRRSGIGCWALDRGIMKKVSEDENFDIRKNILSFAKNERLSLHLVK
jgi:hypothetical protein